MWHHGQERPQDARPSQAVEDDQALLVSRLERELEAEQRRSEEYLDMLRRSQADFINYRRRVGQEQEEASMAAQIALLARLLPVLDDLGRALCATPPELARQPWVQGLHLVARRLAATLAELGIRQIGRQGELFDPRLHEAVALDTQSCVTEGTVMQVVRPGYMLGERIVRPAQVVVAGSTPAPPPASSP
jgi:molecular chaperone GrpE